MPLSTSKPDSRFNYNLKTATLLWQLGVHEAQHQLVSVAQQPHRKWHAIDTGPPWQDNETREGNKPTLWPDGVRLTCRPRCNECIDDGTSVVVEATVQVTCAILRHLRENLLGRSANECKTVRQRRNGSTMIHLSNVKNPKILENYCSMYGKAGCRCVMVRV